MNLDVDSNDTQVLVPGLEGGLTWTPAKDFDVKANVFVGYDLIDDDAAVTSRFQGAGASFVTEGIDNSPLVYAAGIGIAKKFTDRFTLDADYTLDGRGSDFINHTVSCKFTWRL